MSKGDENLEQINDLASSELLGMYRDKKDLGAERLKRNLEVMKMNQKNRATNNSSSGLKFRIIKSFTKDREELKKMVKTQNILPEK